MKKRFLYGILMTFLLVLFLPASTALAIVYGFDFPVDDEYFDNTISDTQGGFTLIISLASENSYVTNYLRYDDEWVVTDPHLMSGQVVTIANTDGADGTIALESDKPITVSLAGNKIFSLNSFVWGNGSAYGDSITISAGSYSKSIPMGPSESQEFIPETSDFQGITSFTISWNDAHEMYFDLFDISLDPIITAQPVNASVEARESVGFSVAAIGNLLSYQWQVDTSGTGSSFADISDGGVYSGATSANLSISGAMSSMNKYQYRCIITGEGGYSTTSNSASLTVSGEEPTDITLDHYSIAENSPIFSKIGTLSSEDADSTDFTYTLVDTASYPDNAAFTISGSDLLLNTVPDYEVKSSYTIKVQTEDESGLTFAKELVIDIEDANDPPTDINLLNTTVAENSALGTAIGELTADDQDAGDSHSFALVSGSGDTDNGSFIIDGNTLKLNAAANYETQSSYSVRIRVSDGFLSYEKIFVITVIDINEAPTDLDLSNREVLEHSTVGTVIGSFSGNDPDAGAVLSYTFASGEGDSDNGSFQIDGEELKLAIVPDYEVKNSYSIRVRVSDGTLFFEKAFTIEIIDGNDPPVAISLDNASVYENNAPGSVVGNLTASDPNTGDSINFTLAGGAGDTDNASFSISGQQLRLGITADYETKSSYSVRIRATDQDGLYYEQEFTVSILNVNEAPTDIELSKDSIEENSPIGTIIGTLTAIDPDIGDTHQFALVAGAGDTDNGSFTIDGNALKLAFVPDYETKNSYSIRIEVSDGENLTFEKQFTITILDGNDEPTDISITSESIPENTPIGIELATLSTTDPNGGSFVYTLVAGDGSTDNDSFQITGNSLSMLETLSEAGLNLELETEDAIVSIPAASLETASEQMEEDLYFRLKPITDEEEKNKLTDRVAKEGMLIKLLGDNLSVIGTPMEIETNIPETQVDIVLPLSGITIPDDEQAREELLSKLAVYVEHSDGEKETIKGELVQNKDGSYGLKFTVSKFSTFTLVKDSRVKSDSCDILKVKTPTDTFISGTFIRATLPNKTTKVKLNITVSEGATWKLYSDKACTKEITNNIKLKEGLNKVYIKVTAEDGVSDQRYMVYLIRSNSDK